MDDVSSLLCSALLCVVCYEDISNEVEVLQAGNLRVQ